MNTGRVAVLLGVAGIGLAWYFNRQQQAAVAVALAAMPQVPAPLPSRTIGDGYLDPITGGTGHAPLSYDTGNGDTTAPLGTDLLLPAVDPSDPALGYVYGLPNVGPVNGDLLAAARDDMESFPSVYVDDANV